jgi:hypothetical protein
MIAVLAHDEDVVKINSFSFLPASGYLAGGLRLVRRFLALRGQTRRRHRLPALAAEVEPRTGNVWVATEKDVVKIDKKGKVLVRVKHKAKTTQAWIAGF